MKDYDYCDVLIDPSSLDAAKLIGKECYFAGNPRDLVSGGINGPRASKGILTGMDDGYFIENSDGYWECIAPAEEEKPECVPLRDDSMFIWKYSLAHEKLKEYPDNLMSGLPGMWLWYVPKDGDGRQKGVKFVTEIMKDGVKIGSSNEITTWKELLENYEFPGAFPCGTEIKE